MQREQPSDLDDISLVIVKLLLNSLFAVQQTKSIPSTQGCPSLPSPGFTATVCGHRVHRTFHAV